MKSINYIKKGAFIFIMLLCTCWCYAQEIIDFTLVSSNTSNPVISNLQSPTMSIQQTVDGIRVTHQFRNALVVPVELDGDAYSLVKIREFGFECEEGRPQLPGYSDIIPVNTSSPSIQVSYTQYVEYYGKHILPAQVYNEEGGIIDNEVVIDDSIYNLNAFYPQNLVSLQCVQSYKGQKVAFVRVNPVQYNPTTGVIRCYSSVQYSISDAPDVLIEDSMRVLEEDSATVSTIQEKYIIVTTDEHLTGIENFVEWKQEQGYQVSVISSAHWTGYEEVRDSIRAEYWRDTIHYSPDYLLIIGSHTEVPGKIVTPSSHNPHKLNYASDHFHACMDGDNDELEDLYRGRVFDTSQLDFIVHCEKNPAFWNKGIHAAYFEKNNDNKPTMEKANCIPFSEDVKQYMENHGFNIERIYKTETDVTPLLYNPTYASGDSIPYELRKPTFAWNGSADSIDAAIQNGCDYLMYKGHGSQYGLDNFNYTSSRLLSLVNQGMACNPILLCFACNCGWFANRTNSGYVQNLPNFGRNALAYGASPCLFVATAPVYAPNLEPFGEAFFSSLYVDSIMSPYIMRPFLYTRLEELNRNNRCEVGHMMNFGILCMLREYGFSKSAKEETCFYQIFGDPSYNFPACAPDSLSRADICRINDSIYINTNGLEDCCIILEKLDDDETVCAYKRIENVCGEYIISDSTDYNNIIIRKNNSRTDVRKHYSSVYLQNKSIYSNEEYAGETIEAGRNVTNKVQVGDVIVKNGGSLKLKHQRKTTLDKGFKVEIGGKLSINK